jgi:hypothetical protein
MSTLKTTNIQHPSAGSPNLVLAADGSVSGGAGLGGLVLVHNETISSAVSEVNIDSVFSATYEVYRIVATIVQSNQTPLRIRFRSAASTYSSNYAFSYQNGTSSVSVGSVTSNDNWDLGTGAITNQNFFLLEVAKPFGANVTTGTSSSANYFGQPSLHLRGLSQTDSQSFDGFRAYISSGTFTGSIRIYGYAND